MGDSNLARLRELLQEASVVFKDLTDDEIVELFRASEMDDLLRAIAPPKVSGEGTIYEYLLQNKVRLQLLARIRIAIHSNYSIRGFVDGTEVFVSPYFDQWVEEGVVFLQGKEQFAGLIGLYQNGTIKFAVAARDIRERDSVRPGDLLFVAPDDARWSLDKAVDRGAGFANALRELERLLGAQENRESAYQAFLTAHPWVLGAQHKEVQSHKNLDDANIPDFTAVRARDGARDIIEIKPPFLMLFTKRGTLRDSFHSAWDQCERYLDFTRTQRHYLLEEKGLRFENPHCYLVLGYNLDESQRNLLERKQRMNPAITIMTYNDLLAMGKSVVKLLERLRSEGDQATEDPRESDGA